MGAFDRYLEVLNLVHHHVFDPVAFPPGVT
ncbi:MAG: hypothetical protein XD45_0751 [Thermotoga sp. 50_64]|nr:MAG: hypothetical protein XD45_0751 [Thermotoga sp. 50_64]